MVNKGKGRQKVDMKKIKKDSSLQVTFSKRRFGLFKKASELCTLCGVHILMIVFSPGGKAYSFGNPDVKDLIYHFFNFNSDVHQLNNNLQVAAIRPHETIKFLNRILTEERAKQETEKSKKNGLDKIKEMRDIEGKWYEKDVKELNLNETNNLISSLEDLKSNLVSEISEYYLVNGSQNLLDQTRMVDWDALNCNPNMDFSNMGPSLGYYNINEAILPGSSMNYMSSFIFNQS